MSNQIIEVDGTEYEFPADMPDDEIKAALNKELGLPPPEHDFSALEMAKNVPGSLWDEISGLASALASPVETAKGVGGLVRGGLSHAMGWDDPAEEQASQFADFYKERYGDWDNFKRALEKDPVGVLGDATAVLGGVGAGLRGAAKVGAGAGAKTAGDVLGKVATAADPIMALNNVPMAALAQTRAIKEAPSGLYQSATGLDAPEANFLLEKRAAPNQQGIAGLEAEKAGLQSQLENAIGESTATANPAELLETLTKRRDEIASTRSPQRAEDLSAANRQINAMQGGLAPTPAPDFIGPTSPAQPLSMPEIQDIKKDQYRRAYKKNQPRSEMAVKERARLDSLKPKQKAARDVGLDAKRIIEKNVPGAKELNEQIGLFEKTNPALIDIANKIESGTYNFSLKDIITAGSVGTGAGYFLGPAAGLAASGAGLLASRMTKPANKMKIGRTLQDFLEKDNVGGLASGPNIQAILAAIREAEEDKENPLLLGM